jgi:tetratricopeptide (TPR) repeat protein
VSVVALFVVVFAVFLPALRNGFVNLDDGVYVTDNPHVLAGFGLDGVRWAFRTFDSGNWHPLTWLSLMLDAQLWGAQAWGFHLSSAVLHALNAALVFVLLRTSTGSTWRSLLVAAFFGVHPLRVESVAWVSERKDVLSTFFGLLSLLAYVAWRRPGPDGGARWRWGVASFACLALGLMSKPMLVTLPCVLLLLDFWPLQRTGGAFVVTWRLVREKLPFFALAAAGMASTMVAQASVGALGNTTAYPFGARLANAVEAYATYLGKTFYPAGLAIPYPFRSDHDAGAVAAAALVLVVPTALAVVWRRPRPYLATGWFWFLGTLVPVIGLVQVGGQAMADRYTYLPSIGLFVALVWGAAEFVAGRRGRTRVAGGLAVAALAVLAMGSVRQIGHWRDSVSLFRRTLAVTERNYFAHHCLAAALVELPGGRDEAVEHLRAAVRLVPGLPDAHYYLATALAGAGGAASDECLAAYRAAVRLDPGYVAAHFGLARALLRTPEGVPEAIAALRRTLALAPGHVDAHAALADALALSPESAAEAEAAYRTALRLDPDRAEVRNSLGLVLARQGRFAAAIAEYEAALQARPGFAQAHNNLANALVRFPERVADAVVHYRAALALNPDYWEVHFNLGLVLADEAEPAAREEALAHFETVLRLRPDVAAAREMIERLRSE